MTSQQIVMPTETMYNLECVSEIAEIYLEEHRTSYCAYQGRESDFITIDEIRINSANLNILSNLLVFQIYIGGVLRFSLPFDLLVRLENPIVENNTIRLKIPSYLYIYKLPVIAIQYHDIMYKILKKESAENINYPEINLITKYEYLVNQSDRPAVHALGHEILLHQISDINYNYHNQIETNVFDVSLHFGGRTKGYFIKSNKLDLNKILLSCDEEHKIDYDKELIETKCKRISDRLFVKKY